MEKKYNEKNFVKKNVEEQCSYFKSMVENLDSRLLNAFMKCSNFVKENCNFDVEITELKTIGVSHVDYWIEDGVLYVGISNNGYCGHKLVLSTIGTDEYSQGSCQRDPYRYEGFYAFENEFLLEFLKKWGSIRNELKIRDEIYNNFEV